MSTTLAQAVEQRLRAARRAQRRDGAPAVLRLVGRSAGDHLMRTRVERRRAGFDERAGLPGGAIQAVVQDAADFVFPDGPTALLLFDPFGAPTLGAVLDRAVASVAGSPRWSLYSVEAPA